MIKKIALIISLVSFVISVFTGAAFASLTPSNDSPKMTDDNTTLPAVDKATFEWDTKPFAYIQFKLEDVGGEPLTVIWTWKFGDSYAATETSTVDDPTTAAGGTDYVNIWKDLTNWDTVKTGKAGDWIVSAHSDGAGGGSIRSDSFKLNSIVPEPVSSALFLIGGTCLAAWQIRRKKKSS